MGSSLSTPGDAALRTVGSVRLWYDIVKSALVVVGLIVAIVLVLLHHRTWKSGSFKVESASCAPPAPEKRCDSNGSCHTAMVRQCSAIKLSGFEQPFASDYTAPRAPPTPGQSVKVFYDPDDRKRAALARNDLVDEYKGLIVALLALIAAGAAVSGAVQYYVRKSHLAQRIAGGVTVVDAIL